MFAFNNQLIRHFGVRALNHNMGPARYSLRVASRSQTSATTASSLVTPRLSSKISKAKLRKFGTLKAEVELGGVSIENSEDRYASEEFNSGGAIPKLEGIKRKLNFDLEMPNMNFVNHSPAKGANVDVGKVKSEAISGAVGGIVEGSRNDTGLGRSMVPFRNHMGKFKSEATSEAVDRIVEGSRNEAGLGRSMVPSRNMQTEKQGIRGGLEKVNAVVMQEHREKVGPRRRDLQCKFSAVKIEEGQEEEAQTEINDVVKPEPREEAGSRRRKLANNIFERSVKVKKEEPKELDTNIRATFKQDSREIFGRRRKTFPFEVSADDTGTGEKGEVRVEEVNKRIHDVIKPRSSEEAGPQRRRKSANTAFVKVLRSTKEVVVVKDIDDILKQEVAEEARPRNRNLPRKVSATHASQVGNAQRSPKASAVVKYGASSIITLSGPYPFHARPIPEECQQAKDLLSTFHGHLPEYDRHKMSCPTIEAPSNVQPLASLAPSRTGLKKHGRHVAASKSGHEKRDSRRSVELALTVRASPKQVDVPNNMATTRHTRERGTVLDSLVVTLLSQNTTDKNSRRAYASLKSTFPSWEEVLRADPKEVEDSIRCGGLAEIKADRIRTILDILFKERGEISMEYVRNMSNEDIKVELSRFKGVGPKTVACLLLFHLQREEFPVDTHVFRISKMLGWVPVEASREKAYLHLNQRIPGFLKFDIHCLFVTHGKRCSKCAARINQQPSDGPCPLLHWNAKWSKYGQGSALTQLDSV